VKSVGFKEEEKGGASHAWHQTQQGNFEGKGGGRGREDEGGKAKKKYLQGLASVKPLVQVE